MRHERVAGAWVYPRIINGSLRRVAMKKFFNALVSTWGVFALLSVSASAAPASNGAPAERIGVYDSRAVAIAYAGSPFQQKKMDALKAAHQRAKDAGDAAEMSRLNAEAKAEQAELHKQGFGTAPVDGLLANIAPELVRIQSETGITLLVSKWNAAALQTLPNAERVDVTMKLVDAFEPNEKQRKYAIEIQARAPQ